jgi:hypothetical protein
MTKREQDAYLDHMIDLCTIMKEIEAWNNAWNNRDPLMIDCLKKLILPMIDHVNEKLKSSTKADLAESGAE